MAKQAPNFQNLYANGMGFTLSPHDARITFGLGDIDTDDTTEQVAIYMSFWMLKVLALTSAEFVKHAEGRLGAEIPVEQSLIDKLKTIRDPQPG